MTVTEAHGHTHTVTAELEDVGPCKKRLKVEVAKDEVAKEINEQIEHVRRTIKVKGFRQGHVPRKFVEKNYRAAIEEDVRKHLLEHSYQDALKSKGVEVGTVLGEGKVEKLKFSAEEGLSYEVTLQVRPRFELPTYKQVKVEVAKLKVTDDDVAKELEGFRKTRGEIRPVDDPKAVVEANDTIACDVEAWLADEYESFAEEQEEKKGKKGEKKKKDEDAEGPLKPLKTYADVEVTLTEDDVASVAGIEVEDLGDALIGLKIGEWGEAETQLPVDFEVAEGKNEAAVLRIKVNGVKRLFLPELTDDWAKSAGYDTVDELRREARENLFRSRELKREDEVETKVVDQLLATIGAFELPQDLIEAEIQDAQKRREVELRMQEQKSEEEAKALVQTESAELRQNVERSLRTFFVIDDIARRESIRVSEADVDARVARIAAASHRPPPEVKKFLDERGVLPQLRHEILNEKTRALLRENAQVVETED